MIKRHYYKNKVKLGANPNINEDGKNMNEIYLDKLINEAFKCYEDYDLNKIVDQSMHIIVNRLRKFGYQFDF